MKFTILSYNPSKNYLWSIHKAGCQDIKKELKGIRTDSGFPASDPTDVEAKDLDEALDNWYKGELSDLGWNSESMNTHDCCHSKKEKVVLSARHNTKSYFCRRCNRVHGNIYRKFEAHMKYQKIPGDTLGKCRICGDNKAIIRKDNITTRNLKGEENPIAICKHCESTKTDFEMIASLLPMNKEGMAKTYIYGTAKVSPMVIDKPITGTVCINDIKKNKLSWEGYIGKRQKTGSGSK